MYWFAVRYRGGLWLGLRGSGVRWGVGECSGEGLGLCVRG